MTNPQRICKTHGEDCRTPFTCAEIEAGELPLHMWEDQPLPAPFELFDAGVRWFMRHWIVITVTAAVITYLIGKVLI